MHTEIKEHGNVTVILDGMAASMGAFILPFAKKVVAYDMAQVMLHRADAYTGDDEGLKNMLAEVNKNLRTKIDKTVDSETFETVTGYTMDQLFDPESRLDVWLTAKQAKKIGLVDEVKPMTPEVAAQIAAHFKPVAEEPKPQAQTSTNSNSNTMTIQELKGKHPEIYNSIVAEAQQNEKDRVRLKENGFDRSLQPEKFSIPDCPRCPVFSNFQDVLSI